MNTMINGTEMYHDAIRRIHELERLNSALAAEIDRARPLVEAAIKYRHERPFAFMTLLDKAVDTYEQSSREG
jgi:hypothetical protein